MLLPFLCFLFFTIKRQRLGQAHIVWKHAGFVFGAKKQRRYRFCESENTEVRMKRLFIIVFVGAAVCSPSSKGTKRAELNVSPRKEILAKARKFIDEMKAMLDKGNAIDNNITSEGERLKAHQALQKQNPKAYYVLGEIHMQFAVSAAVADKETMKKIRAKVRADVAKLLTGLNAALEKKIDILDDKSKNSVEKLKSLAKLTQESPKMDHVLQIMIGKLD
ncbi:unnamed protein product [Cylicocyclus nassatus]|uniref:Uncharacterized protein n=1 Tax=Cylicocyclus nassatus TaxID=53992 RepID=A0AA36GMP9_CYLNA|nr:unnamed protein product [Cylicocyclus nassatus]